MIIQIVLSVALVSILIYFLLTSRRPSVISFVVTLGTGSGLLFVWQPELTQQIAVFIGVGRGADMIFYSWLVVSLALFLNFHVKQRAYLESLTILARELAILNAKRSGDQD